MPERMPPASERIPERDAVCCWCEFEGHSTIAFAYHNSKYGHIYWCSRCQSYVPAGATRESIPPSAGPWGEVFERVRR